MEKTPSFRMNVKHHTKKLLAVVLTTLFASSGALAQNEVKGTTYYLPQTAIQFSVLVERTATQPGDLCMYSERFLKKSDVAMKPTTQYRILDITARATGVRDTSKMYTANINSKHSIVTLKVNEDGIIEAVNTTTAERPKPKRFVPAPKQQPLNPRDYMNQDILTAASKAKTAELVAQEIYDIRESRNQLNKGQADFMPKDGEQLRLMLNNLNTQETVLLQLFEGITERDTVEHIITYIPTKEVNKDVLFRFSQKLGLVDKDDLAGAPFYISIADLHSMPTNAAVSDEKRSKDDANIYVTMPGKISFTLHRSEQELMTQELYAGQFGKTAPLDNEFFGRKLFTTLVYDPVTGSVEDIKTEPMK